MIPVVWDEARVLPSADGGDTLFRAPTQPVPYRGGLVIGDSYHGTVTRLAPDGRVLWTVHPGDGSSPGAIRDVEQDAMGRLWVLDQRRGRAVVLDSAGRPQRVVSIAAAGEPPLSLLPLRDGSVVILTARADTPLVVLDRAGIPRGEARIPWDSLRRVHPLAAQVTVDKVPGTDRWIAALVDGDGFFRFDGARAVGDRSLYVEHVEFPAIQTTTRREGAASVSVARPTGPPIDAALSLAASPERLYVLFGGRTPRRRRMLDVYSLATGAYLESYLLPRRTSQIAWSEGGLVTVSYEPEVTIRRLTARGRRLP